MRARGWARVRVTGVRTAAVVVVLAVGVVSLTLEAQQQAAQGQGVGQGAPARRERAVVPRENVVISPKARDVHFGSIVVDTHVDVTLRMSGTEAFDIAKRYDTGHVDIPRMKEGGLNAIFFSIYMSGRTTGPVVVKRSLDLIDAVRQAVAANPKELMLATTAADVRRARKEGKIAALMGMEGGHMIDDDLAVLRMYAALGVRYLTLTHSVHVNWADSSGEAAKNNGLTEFGKDVVRELNRQGVMVDISHVSDKTFWDALEVSRAPMIASHSSLRSISNHSRNMTDEMVAALAKKGGVIQITFVDTFLDEERRVAAEGMRAERAARVAEADKIADEAARREARRAIDEEFYARGPKASWEKIVEHIERAVKIAGVDHVGIGSDFDGASMPVGMEDVTRLPKITDALLKKGYSEKDVKKILGENLLRVMEEVEKVSREMKTGKM